VARVLLLAGLGLAGSGCSWIGIVTQSEFKKEKEQTQTRLEGVRKELLAHTQILANHGKAIYEVRLQMRDALSGKPAESTARAMPEEKPAEKPAPARREMEPPRESGRTMYIRSAYQGFPLNYAAGYRAPRGQRFPYRLAPGTEVRVLSGDDRGFTQVEVRSGSYKGRRMWVRTRWLVGERPSRGRG
jgi:hypothetical protein